MTRKFLESIGMPTIDEYVEENAEFGKPEESFYLDVLHRTDEASIGILESFLNVFQDSTALTLVGNLIKWAAQTLPLFGEMLSARAECREALNDN